MSSVISSLQILLTFTFNPLILHYFISWSDLPRSGLQIYLSPTTSVAFIAISILAVIAPARHLLINPKSSTSRWFDHCPASLILSFSLALASRPRPLALVLTLSPLLIETLKTATCHYFKNINNNNNNNKSKIKKKSKTNRRSCQDPVLCAVLAKYKKKMYSIMRLCLFLLP